MYLGETNFDKNKHGPRNIFENSMNKKWALKIDGFNYGDQNMTDGVGAKLAIIDSGNSTI